MLWSQVKADLLYGKCYWNAQSSLKSLSCPPSLVSHGLPFFFLWHFLCLCFDFWNIQKYKKKTFKKTVLCIEEQNVNIFISTCRIKEKLTENRKFFVGLNWALKVSRLVLIRDMNIYSSFVLRPVRMSRCKCLLQIIYFRVQHFFCLQLKAEAPLIRL